MNGSHVAALCPVAFAQGQELSIGPSGVQTTPRTLEMALRNLQEVAFLRTDDTAEGGDERG